MSRRFVTATGTALGQQICRRGPLSDGISTSSLLGARKAEASGPVHNRSAAQANRAVMDVQCHVALR